MSVMVRAVQTIEGAWPLVLCLGLVEEEQFQERVTDTTTDLRAEGLDLEQIYDLCTHPETEPQGREL